MYDIYLEKDGNKIAEVGSYKAGKKDSGEFFVSAYKIYPSDYGVMQGVDIAELHNLWLVCETYSRRIRYHIPGWLGDGLGVTEENGAIMVLQAVCDIRKECLVD